MSDEENTEDTAATGSDVPDEVTETDAAETPADEAEDIAAEGEDDAEESDLAAESAEPEAIEGEPTPTDRNAILPYDFAHPSHKLNSRLPVLDVINEKIGHALATRLSAQFHQAIAVTLKETTFEKYESYADSLPASVSISRFRLNPLNGSGICILDGDLVFMLVDSFFGGVDGLKEPLGQRQFTPTELRISDRIRHNLFDAMMESWEPIACLKPEHETMLTFSEFTSPAHPSAVVVCTKYEVELKAGKGDVHVMIPYSVLEPLRAELTNDLQKMSERNRQWQREFTEQIMACDTDIEGVFAESKISVRQLMNLKVGDFIPLGKVQTVNFSSEGIPLFEASVGVSNGMVSASVRKWHERKRIIQ